MTVSILGSGWLGKALAIHLSKIHDVKLSSRTNEDVESLRLNGFNAYQVDFKSGKFIGHTTFFQCDNLIMCINPDKDSIPGDYTEGLKCYLELAKEHPVKAIIFTSTCGLYGDNAGVYDENSEINPKNESSKLIAEGEVIIQSSGIKSYILRLAGLIGPDRDPGKFLSGKKQLPNPETPVNLVYQSDVINVIAKIIDNNYPHGIYNLCSDEHPGRKDYYTRKAKESGLPEPEFLTSPIGVNRIISNEKVKNIVAYKFEPLT